MGISLEAAGKLKESLPAPSIIAVIATIAVVAIMVGTSLARIGATCFSGILATGGSRNAYESQPKKLSTRDGRVGRAEVKT